MADRSDRGGGAQQMAAFVTSAAPIAGLSRASLTRWAEKHANKVLEVWKDIENGKEVDHDDAVVQRALEWRKAIPVSISKPNVKSDKRCTEAYWILWAHTQSGGQKVKRWRGILPGLGRPRESKSSCDTQARPNRKSKDRHKLDSGYGPYEVQRFLRELLTTGTKLNRSLLKAELVGFTAEELIALASLRSPDRTLTESGIVRHVNRVFKLNDGQKMSRFMRGDIKSMLKGEEISFDNDFVLVGYVKKWASEKPMFRLPAGQENKILKKWYHFGQVGHFNDPATPSLGNQLLLDDLPVEIKVMIIRYLVKFDSDIHIVNKTGAVRPARMTYDFVIARPGHLIKTDSTGVDGILGPHEDKVWSMDAGILALALTDRSWRKLVQEVFFKENCFVGGPFGSNNIPGNSKRDHCSRWGKVIGEEAKAFLLEGITSSTGAPVGTDDGHMTVDDFGES